jgi:type III restriction enzyme
LPAELEGAIQSLYGHYRQQFELWQADASRKAAGATPPVFVVVCNNTSVSKLVFDYIAGWSKMLPDDTQVVVPGALLLFSNVENERWTSRPNSILVDSEQLESGEGMSDEFKRMAAVEIEEFKAEYRQRFPGRDADELTDEDLLREVMNTVGKAGKLGERVRCVVSVSMLTEGWDANTVTHILGVRAFGTQLLCEQVVGRGLRRMNYAVNNAGRFEPEYAEVYGVPFSFIPTSGGNATPQPGPPYTRVRALEERIACEITFPRLTGYRFDTPTDRLSATFTDDAKLAISTADVPTRTENAPIVGTSAIHTLDDLRKRREAEVPFVLAKLVAEKYYRKPFVFPQLLAIAKQWMARCLTLKNAPDTFPQLVLLSEFAHDAADRIYRAIVVAHDDTSSLKPLLRPFDTVGSTRWVDFDTTKPVMPTHPDRCHVSHVVADTGSWEQKTAQVLEELDEVICYVKNQGLNFTIPYTINGESRQYVPDFIARVRPDLSLIIEVSGEAKKDKAAKTATARTLWVPAVNAHGGFGRWAFVEVTDPWDAKSTIRAAITAALQPA